MKRREWKYNQKPKILNRKQRKVNTNKNKTQKTKAIQNKHMEAWIGKNSGKEIKPGKKDLIKTKTKP